MRLYTSYWNNPAVKKEPWKDVRKIRTCRGGPIFLRYDANLGHAPFAPTQELHEFYQASDKGEEAQDAYARAYRRRLEEAGFENVWTELLRAADGAEAVILLCHEKPPKFCHRRLLAQFIEEHTGEVVAEIEAREFGNAVASYRVSTRNVTATSHASVTVADTPQCAECGRVLSTAKRPHKFCSDGCRWTFHNRMRRQRGAAGRTESCMVCGTEFTATRSDASMCSHACKQMAYRQRTRAF